mgnify:FL=1
MDRFHSMPKAGRGVRKALSEAIGSPTSHISQVLNGNSHFSLEQAEAVNEFLGHNGRESDFFLLLVQRERAGSNSLRSRLDGQIDQLVEKSQVLKDRLGVKEGLSREDQVRFYSSWIYGAIHVMLAIPGLQSGEAISQHFGISLRRTIEILEFLESVGLARQASPGRFEIGEARIHLGNDSNLISKFHTNWRVRAIQSFDDENFEQSLHYSSAISISESDFKKIKAKLIQTIEEIKKTIRASDAEKVYSLSIDFFNL